MCLANAQVTLKVTKKKVLFIPHSKTVHITYFIITTVLGIHTCLTVTGTVISPCEIMQCVEKKSTQYIILGCNACSLIDRH